MGTNYYLRSNCCEHCNRYDDLHIGKQSIGWKFIFQAYKDKNLTTVALWLQEIRKPNNKVYDEYDRHIKDKESFIQDILQSIENPNLKLEPPYIGNYEDPSHKNAIFSNNDFS